MKYVFIYDSAWLPGQVDAHYGLAQVAQHRPLSITAHNVAGDDDDDE